MSMYDALHGSLRGYKMSGLDKLLTNEEVRALVRATFRQKPDHQGTLEEGCISTYNLSSLDLSPELRASISAKIQKIEELNDPSRRQNMSALKKIASFFRS